jgi:mRNA-degrading endonuclease RelE of RelBE toxin-antitoxin system
VARKILTFQIEYSPEAVDHLRDFSARQRTIVLDSVDRHLRVQPDVVTRNRKLLRANEFATRELRIGDLRVYYDVEESPIPIVRVRAVGAKAGNIVRIGGKVVEL